MNRSRSDGASVFATVALTAAVLVPVAFWRGAFDTFDLTKGTLLWGFGSFLLVGALLGLGDLWRDRPVALAVGALSVALLLSLALSQSPWMTFFGQSQRYTGVATLIACLSIFIVTAKSAPSEKRLELLLVPSLLISVYCLLQLSGNDPFEWGITSFGQQNFSLMGNPNTSAFVVSGLLPLWGIWVFSKKNSRLKSFAGYVGLSLSLATIAALSSFQGYVGPVAVLMWALFRAFDRKSDYFDFIRLFFIGILVVFILPQPNVSSTYLKAIIAGCLVGIAMVFLGSWGYLRTSIRAGTRITALSLIAIGFIASASKLWNWLSQGLENGFIERGDFYRAGWRMFLANPVLGRGIETFGLDYTSYRSEGAATRFEGSVTSSAHSIPLGMFATGGLVVGLAFLAISAVVSLRAIKILIMERSSHGVLALVGCWFAIVIQSLVSVEHVGIFVVLFFVGGLVIATERHLRGSDDGSSRLVKVKKRSGFPVWSQLLAGGLALVVLMPLLLLRPMSSNIALKDTYENFNRRGDVEASKKSIQRAVDLSPWDSTYWTAYADLYALTKDFEKARVAANNALSTSNFNPLIVDPMARVLVESGEYSGAIEAWERAIKGDPFAAGLRRLAEAFFQEAADALAGIGLFAEADRMLAARGRVSDW